MDSETPTSTTKYESRCYLKCTISYMRNIYCQHTFPLRAFRLKKALQDSQVVAPKLHPKA